MSNLAKELHVPLHVHLLENISQRADQALEALALANALDPVAGGFHLAPVQRQQ